MKQFVSKVSVIVIVVLSFFSAAVTAQESQRALYYVAADEAGTQQVFQLLPGEGQKPRQLTHAAADVFRFGIAYDGLGIAYTSDGQLWLQPVHTDEAEALARADVMQMWTGPVFSQDGNYVAYEDQGVWLYDLANRQTRQILANIPVTDSASNTNEFRVFRPQTFVLNADGVVTSLIVDVWTSEWNTKGVYDLTSGELHELEGTLHTSILPLSDGRVLVYGNSPVGGEGSLYLAESLDTINSATPLAYFAEFAEATLFAKRAVEIKPGVVRIIGEAMTLIPDDEQPRNFYFDFDVHTGEADEVHLVTLPENVDSQNSYVDIYGLSPDGSFIPVYLSPLFADAGIVYGQIRLMNLATEELVDLEISVSISLFQFQP